MVLDLEHLNSEFVSACPPRPETGTGSGGATLLGHSLVAAVFRNSSSGPHSLKARSGPGI